MDDAPAGFLVQIGNRDGTATPIAIFVDEAMADACIDELRANEGGRVRMTWATISVQASVPQRPSFEVVRIPIIPPGSAPTTRIAG